jgi:hypothetical protein
LGRRRYQSRRYRRREDEESGLEAALAAAFRSGVVGVIIVVVLVIAAVVCLANPRALFGMSSFVGAMLLLVAGLTGLVTVAGLVVRRGHEIAECAGLLFVSVAKSVMALLRLSSSAARSRSPQPPPLARQASKHPIAAMTARPLVPPAPPRPEARQEGPARQAFSGPTSSRSMLSKGEMAFYDPLRDIVAGRFEIHIKPSLADVLQYRNDPRAKRIAAMHVDFLLCDVQTLQPRLAIELDDRSHGRENRSAADRWKQELLAEKRIPLLRLRCQAAYDVQSVKEAIEHAIA